MPVHFYCVQNPCLPACRKTPLNLENGNTLLVFGVSFCAFYGPAVFVCVCVCVFFLLSSSLALGRDCYINRLSSSPHFDSRCCTSLFSYCIFLSLSRFQLFTDFSPYVSTHYVFISYFLSVPVRVTLKLFAWFKSILGIQTYSC